MTSLIKSLFIPLFSFFLIGNSNAQWAIEKCPTTDNLNSISLTSSSSGWIVGDNGTLLYKFRDAWFKYQKVTTANLFSIHLLNKDEGWAVGSSGTMLHYNGKKWEIVPCPTQRNLYSVSFLDSSYGIAVGEQGTVIIYKDGAWTLLENVPRGNLYTVASKKDMSMLAGGIEYGSIPVMTISGDSETNIKETYDPGFFQIKSLAITDNSKVWAVGRPGSIFHFNGSNWIKLEQFERLSSLKSVCFSDENTGVAVGYGGTILSYSEDGWVKESSPVSVKLNGAAFSGNTIYAVGDKGTIITLNRKPATFRSPTEPNSTVLGIESYPNPSTDILNITVPEEDDFNAGLLTLTDASGKVILMKRLDSDSAGQVYRINTSKLATGLYMISIKSVDNRLASGKFIVRR